MSKRTNEQGTGTYSGTGSTQPHVSAGQALQKRIQSMSDQELAQYLQTLDEPGLFTAIQRMSPSQQTRVLGAPPGEFDHPGLQTSTPPSTTMARPRAQQQRMDPATFRRTQKQMQPGLWGRVKQAIMPQKAGSSAATPAAAVPQPQSGPGYLSKRRKAYRRPSTPTKGSEAGTIAGHKIPSLKELGGITGKAVQAKDGPFKGEPVDKDLYMSFSKTEAVPAATLAADQVITDDPISIIRQISTTRDPRTKGTLGARLIQTVLGSDINALRQTTKVLRPATVKQLTMSVKPGFPLLLEIIKKE